MNVIDLHPQPVGVSHLVGPDITFQDLLRQRCVWCGVAIVDEDLSRVMVASGDAGEPGEAPVLHWTPGSWVRIVPGNPSTVSVIETDEGIAPDDACMRDRGCTCPGGPG